jgi:hypothetical protein
MPLVFMIWPVWVKVWMDLSTAAWGVDHEPGA